MALAELAHEARPAGVLQGATPVGVAACRQGSPPRVDQEQHLGRNDDTSLMGSGARRHTRLSGIVGC